MVSGREESGGLRGHWALFGQGLLQNSWDLGGETGWGMKVGRLDLAFKRQRVENPHGALSSWTPCTPWAC